MHLFATKETNHQDKPPQKQQTSNINTSTWTQTHNPNKHQQEHNKHRQDNWQRHTKQKTLTLAQEQGSMYFCEANGYIPTCSEATKPSMAKSMSKRIVQKHKGPTAAVPYYEMRGLGPSNQVQNVFMCTQPSPFQSKAVLCSICTMEKTARWGLTSV